MFFHPLVAPRRGMITWKDRTLEKCRAMIPAKGRLAGVVSPLPGLILTFFLSYLLTIRVQ